MPLMFTPVLYDTVRKMLQSVDFEVFGIVQGVFFRKYTREKGKELGLKGWCMNTRQDTVVGTIQGKEEQIAEMKDWLRHTGSPMSKIEKCVFKNDRHISKEEFDDFFIKGITRNSGNGFWISTILCRKKCPITKER